MPLASSILDQLQIATPCSADWASMCGDERSRVCATCQKHVYNLSTMRAGEALALIWEKEGSVCVRLWRRADGTVLTADCPVGRRQLDRRRVWAPLGAASLLALGLGCRAPRTEARLTVTTGGAVVDLTDAGQTRAMSSADLDHLPLR